MSDLIRVKRDGPRGWHWIDEARFDPDVHERVDPADGAESGDGSAAEQGGTEARPRGRPPKAK